MKTVQYRHRQRRHSDKQNVGKHQAIQIDSFDLYLILSEHRKQADRQRRKNYAQNRQSGQNSGKRPKQSIRERPGFLAGAIPHVIGEYRDERSRHRSFPDQAAKEIRDSICQDKRIGDARGSQ